MIALGLGGGMRLAGILLISAALASAGRAVPCPDGQSEQAVRFAANPLLDINTDPRLGDNINGPSVIAVPDWLPNPLGKFYMYFADHAGDHVKLAYADRPTGPWTLHPPGTLQLSQAASFEDHIASPDVHVDHAARSIRMYFHGVKKGGSGMADQKTGVAHSQDGLNFRADPDIQGMFYFRVFRHGDSHYAIAKHDNNGFMSLYRGKTGLGDWQFGRDILARGRHAAVDVRGDRLSVYHSRVGDLPEHILVSRADLSRDWSEWQFSEAETLLLPDMPYEGSQHAIADSRYGAATNVRQLRDPAIFRHEGQTFLYYSGEGEETINGAELVCRENAGPAR